MDNITKWVNEAQPERLLFRQAVHTILHAITIDDYLRSNMIMKGGMLLGIQHGNSRFTEDIDFSTAQKDIQLDEFREQLNNALIVSADDLPYTLACEVQSGKLQPRKGGKFQSFQLTIGYANTQEPSSLRRLRRQASSDVIKIDYSLNEASYSTEEISISEDGECLVAYSIVDILAEKLRSIIQQVVRNRHRRQDIYDIWHLLNKYDLEKADLVEILGSFIKKSKHRIDAKYIDKNALQNKEIIEASRHDYNLLIDEVEGDLPDFEDAYREVRVFYENLPWE